MVGRYQLQFSVWSRPSTKYWMGHTPVSWPSGLSIRTWAIEAVPRVAAVPDWMGNLFEGLDDDPETRRLLAGAVAAETCARLEEEGFSEFHFYTLNRADLVYAICHLLGVRAQREIAS